MASKVLKSFLIGIGWDTRALEEGDKKISASLGSIKSGALGISAALVGAFGFAASAVVGVSDRVDKLAMSTQNLRTSMNTVYSFGSAVKLMGGEASEALDALKGFEEIQNNLRLKGEAGPINDLAMAGIDVSSLYETNTGEEFMRALSSMIPKLDEGQRSVVQGSLGLSDGVFRSLAGGVDQLDTTMKRASALTGSVDQLTENARNLADNSAQFGLIVEGIKNELADKFLPSLVGASNAVNSFLKEYRPEVSKAIDYASDNPEATAVLGGSATATLIGATLAKFGLGTIGGAIGSAGAVGVSVSGSAVGANLLNRAMDENVPGYSGASREFDDLLKRVTGLERIKGPLELMFGGGPGVATAPAPVSERRDISSIAPAPGPAPVAQGKEVAHYKEIPAPNVDGLVAAIHAAKLNVSNPATESADISESISTPPAGAQTGTKNYKDIPSPQVDDLVRAMQEARASVNQSIEAADRQRIDNSPSGVIDRAEGYVPPAVEYRPSQPEIIYGERSASDVVPPTSASTPDEDRKASAEALAGALSRAPIKVQSQIGLTLQIDGQALDNRITNVTERQNYEALGDLRTTTER